ncbi:hypothetical protein NKH77_55885 [Streptomyces sp. M19]
MARPMNPLPRPRRSRPSPSNCGTCAGGRPTTLHQMADICGVSTASLSKAHGGKERPSWPTVRGYVQACGAISPTGSCCGTGCAWNTSRSRATAAVTGR